MIREWQQYLAAIDSLTQLDGQLQQRYAAADDQHRQAGSGFDSEQGAVERKWKQLADQAARSQASGEELMRRYRLGGHEPPSATAQGASATLAASERTVAWCVQAARWVSGYEERANALAAAASAPPPKAATAPPPVPPVSMQPSAKARRGCGQGAAAMLMVGVGAVVAVALKVMGVI